MQLTFDSNKTTEISFKLGIAGTGSTPSTVTVVLERDDVALSFVASQDGESWKALIQSPGKMLGTGQVKVSINVILNGHLFTPIRTVGEIIGTAEEVKDEQEQSQQATPSLDTPHEEETTPELDSEPEQTFTFQEDEPKLADPVKIDADYVKKLFADITRSDTVREQKTTSILKSIEAPIERKPVQLESAPVIPTPKALVKVSRTKVVFK